MAEKTTLMVKGGGVIPLTRRLVKILNIKDGDRFDVIFAEEGYLFLSALGEKDARLSLSGDLVSTNIADIFSILNMGQRTGKLIILSSGKRKNIYFKKGEIIYASSNEPDFLLGKILYRTGFLTKSQLEEAEKIADETDERFGSILIKKDFITPKQLWTGVKYQLEEIVYSSFEMNSGYFIFLEDVEPPSDIVEFSLNTQHILMEGFRRLDERAVIKKAIPSLDSKVFIVPNKTVSGLSENLKKTYMAIEDGATIGDIIRKTRLGEFTTLKLLHNLITMNFIKVEGAEEEREEVKGEEELQNLVLKYNSLFAKIISFLKERGVHINFKEQILDFIDTMNPKDRELFRDVKIDESGFFDSSGIVENAESLLLVDTEKFLKIPELELLLIRQKILEGLGKIQSFLLFTARNSLSEEDFDKLHKDIQKIKSEILHSR